MFHTCIDARVKIESNIHLPQIILCIIFLHLIYSENKGIDDTFIIKLLYAKLEDLNKNTFLAYVFSYNKELKKWFRLWVCPYPTFEMLIIMLY